jgi:hypothetical protein
MTDEAFYKRYPEMKGKPIDPSTQPELAREWMQDRAKVLQRVDENTRTDQTYYAQNPERAGQPAKSSSQQQDWLKVRNETIRQGGTSAPGAEQKLPSSTPQQPGPVNPSPSVVSATGSSARIAPTQERITSEDLRAAMNSDLPAPPPSSQPGSASKVPSSTASNGPVPATPAVDATPQAGGLSRSKNTAGALRDSVASGLSQAKTAVSESLLGTPDKWKSDPIKTFETSKSTANKLVTEADKIYSDYYASYQKSALAGRINSQQRLEAKGLQFRDEGMKAGHAGHGLQNYVQQKLRQEEADNPSSYGRKYYNDPVVRQKYTVELTMRKTIPRYWEKITSFAKEEAISQAKTWANEKAYDAGMKNENFADMYMTTRYI